MASRPAGGDGMDRAEHVEQVPVTLPQLHPGYVVYVVINQGNLIKCGVELIIPHSNLIVELKSR